MKTKFKYWYYRIRCFRKLKSINKTLSEILKLALLISDSIKPPKHLKYPNGGIVEKRNNNKAEIKSSDFAEKIILDFNPDPELNDFINVLKN